MVAVLSLLLIAILVTPITAFADCDDDPVAQEIYRLKRQLVDSRPVLREPYPDVIRLKREIDALEREYQACKRAEAFAKSPPSEPLPVYCDPPGRQIIPAR